MTFTEYMPLARRTCVELETRLEDNIHMVLGVLGEFAEFAKCNNPNEIDYEAGDVLWYPANWYLINNREFTNNPGEMSGMFFYIAELGEMYKKALAYKKPEDVDRCKELMDTIVSTMFLTLNTNGKTPSYIMALNIRKLKTRFPDNFTEELAINKDIQKEIN